MPRKRRARSDNPRVTHAATFPATPPLPLGVDDRRRESRPTASTAHSSARPARRSPSATRSGCCSTRARIFRPGSPPSQRRSTTSCSRATSSPTTPSAIEFVEALAAKATAGRARSASSTTGWAPPSSAALGAAARGRCRGPLLQSAESRKPARMADARSSQVDRRRWRDRVRERPVRQQRNGKAIARSDCSRGATRASSCAAMRSTDIEAAFAPGLARMRRRAARTSRGRRSRASRATSACA